MDPHWHYSSHSPKSIPESLRYHPVHLSSASWIEEQRVLRALWRVLLFHELVPSALLFLSGGGQKVPLCQNLWSNLGQCESMELLFVYKYILELSNKSKSSLRFGLPLVNRIPVALPASRPVDNDWSNSWDQLESDLSLQSPGANIMRVLRLRHDSPIHNMNVMPLWRLGLGIWDKRRLAFLGLLSAPRCMLDKTASSLEKDCLSRARNDKNLTMDDLFTRWYSIMASFSNIRDD